MASVAMQIVHGIAQALRDQTDAAHRVYTDRLHPSDDSDLPCWLVLLDKDDVTESTIHWPRLQQRTLLLMLVGKTRAVEGMDAALDQMAQQARGVLFSAVDAVQVAGMPVNLAETVTHHRLADGAEFAHGQVVMSLVAEYAVAENAPDTRLG